MHDDELKYIEKLDNILREYRYEERIMLFILEVFAIVVVLGIYFILGFIGCLIVVSILTVCLDKLGASLRNAPIKKEKLAYLACDTMQALIDIKKGKLISYDGVRILNDYTGKNDNLYQEFTKYYPSLASKKLKNLASVNIPQYFTITSYK